jgi:hypothetical protein
MFLLLIGTGILKIIFTKTKAEKSNKILSTVSIGINIFMVLFLALTRAVYPLIIGILLLVIKGVILLKSIANNKNDF